MRIGIATSGLWELRDAIELIAEGRSCRLPPFGWGVDAIAGWGHKPTAARARRIARRRGIPYLAFEDGFLRSINPGNDEKPLSLVMDRSGIYYDARQPSDLEVHIHKRISAPLPETIVQDAINLLREKRLSKYNNSTLTDISHLDLKMPNSGDRVLIVDQTACDASITGAMASDDTFGAMLNAAVQENPEAEILIRIHPETIAGRKAGHFSEEILHHLAETNIPVAKALQENRLRLTPEPINPWTLLEACLKVYCVSSQLGFEALMAGCEVHCFGMPFYGGWGLTNDRLVPAPKRRSRATLGALFSAIFFDYCKYINYSGMYLIEFHEAVELLEKKKKTFLLPKPNGA